MTHGKRLLRRSRARPAGGLAGCTGGQRLVVCIAGGLVPALLSLGVMGVVIPAPHAVAATLARPAARPVSSVVGFPGPASGAPDSQRPHAVDFRTSCNVGVNTYAMGTVAGTPVLTGTAISGSDCGTASLLIDAPGPGRFHALFGIDDSDSTGQPAIARFTVLGRNGDSVSSRVMTTRGSVAPVDLDVSRAVAILVSFPTTKAQKYYLYGFSLRGTARTLRPLRGGNALPAGAMRVNMAAAHYTCNTAAAVPTTPLTVTQVGIATVGTVVVADCGQAVLGLNPSQGGTLVLRYGRDDNSTFKVNLATLTVRVLGLDGRLLRKAVGATRLGTGLQELWVDVSGAKTVTLSGDSSIVVTAVGLVPHRLPLYRLPDLTLSGGPSGRSVSIDPDAFVTSCNVHAGTDDATVGGKPVFGGEYLATSDCGGAGLIMCCTTARGTFHALFGIPDTDTAGAHASVTIVAKDKDNHVLRSKTVSANYGTSVGISIGVDKASVLTFLFPGAAGVLYDLRLSGSATISELVYPPVVLPMSSARGVAVNPNDFSLKCNVAVATTDQPLVGATALEGWALVGSSCGEADLILSGVHYPHHGFSARVGILRLSPLDTNATITLHVLNSSGTTIRTAKLNARYGYGTQPIHIDLTGGATLQILADDHVVLYAMTATP